MIQITEMWNSMGPVFCCSFLLFGRKYIFTITNQFLIDYLIQNIIWMMEYDSAILAQEIFCTNIFLFQKSSTDQTC